MSSQFQPCQSTQETVEIGVGPIQITISVPAQLTSDVLATYKNWLRPGDTGSEVIHRSTLDVDSSAQWNGRRIQLLTVDQHTSIWRSRPNPELLGSPRQFCEHIDKLLRRVIHTAAIYHEGGLIHAAGLVINGNGWLVPGESGLGKSTLFTLLGGLAGGHLHDDLILVFKDRLYAQPSQSSNLALAEAKPANTPWRGLLFLSGRSSPIKSTRHEFGSKEATRLLPCFAQDEHQDLEFTLSWFGRMIDVLLDKNALTLCYDAEVETKDSLVRHLKNL